MTFFLTQCPGLEPTAGEQGKIGVDCPGVPGWLGGRLLVFLVLH
jgi:hypothetical protein